MKTHRFITDYKVLSASTASPLLPATYWIVVGLDEVGGTWTHIRRVLAIRTEVRECWRKRGPDDLCCSLPRTSEEAEEDGWIFNGCEVCDQLMVLDSDFGLTTVEQVLLFAYEGDVIEHGLMSSDETPVEESINFALKVKELVDRLMEKVKKSAATP